MKKSYFTIIVLLSMFAFNLHAAEDDDKEPAPSGIVLTQERKVELNNIDIPIMNFSLKDGAFPDFDCVSAPEGGCKFFDSQQYICRGRIVSDPKRRCSV